jgi:hypothetical protein
MPQAAHTGARAWIAHSKLSKTWTLPCVVTWKAGRGRLPDDAGRAQARKACRDLMILWIAEERHATAAMGRGPPFFVEPHRSKPPRTAEALDVAAGYFLYKLYDATSRQPGA